MKKSTRLVATNFAPAIGLGLVCVVAVAILLAGRESSPSVDIWALEAQPQAAEPAVKTVPMAQTEATRTEAPKAPAASAFPAERLMADRTLAEAPNVEPTSNALVADLPRVTITGCLEHDDEKFRLKGATGADAPKSRSWKSGFLKKRSASLEVVDTAKRLELPNHVGRRVSVTGVLQDQEMQVYSVRRLAASCD